MTDLIAQGTQTHQRWRHELLSDRPLVLGRSLGPWGVPWDDHISHRHAELIWDGRILDVRRIATAVNPIFVHGQQTDHFQIHSGDHFVIGHTTFSIVDEEVDVVANLSEPSREQSFSPQYLRRAKYHHASERIDVLSRLPQLIADATNEATLFSSLVNLLLSGIPRADAVALVAAHPDQETGQRVQLLHWDRRRLLGGRFRPSERLILKAARSQQSVLHSWSASDRPAEFTASENLDWAFTSPVPNENCPGWCIYVAGSFGQTASDPGGESDPTDLRDDLKFTELVASVLGSLWQLKLLERRNASFSQFFSPAVLAALSETDPDVVLTPRETEVTVLFCDLRGFSKVSEESAGDLKALLDRVSQALGVSTHHILEHGGVVGDFQGDAVMGFWGWPVPQKDRLLRVCRAALGIRRQMDIVAQKDQHPLAGFQMGVGIATGRAIAGKIGTADQVKVTVFGPVVNLASRLEGMTKILHTPILVDETTAGLIRAQIQTDQVRLRRVARVKPYGMQTALDVTELLPPESESLDLSNIDLGHYEAAVEAFIAGNWSEAFALLDRVPTQDRVKDFLLVRIAEHNRLAPPDWNGVIDLTSKR